MGESWMMKWLITTFGISRQKRYGILLHMQQFPTLFTATQITPKKRKRAWEARPKRLDSNVLRAWRKWGNVETGKLPRTLCTTLAMSPSAFNACSTLYVRRSELEKSLPLQLAQINIPTTALCCKGSTAVVDALQFDSFCVEPERLNMAYIRYTRETVRQG